MSFRFVRPLLYAALLLPAALTQAMAAPCAPTQMRFKVFEGTVSSSTAAFAVIPGAALTFTQGGTVPSCVVVRFSAASSVIGGGTSTNRLPLGRRQQAAEGAGSLYVE
jgi:hypothetical protein